ncbi:VOC family protein [Natronorarus salvus]|uniref:VOC family protein n=1 Tax=Natronorarus salvus TaxID=3117733 RepID=UPI002F2604BF
MVDCLLNHVAIDVDDLEEAVAFYTDLFEMERVPTPDFGTPYAWLEFGGQQLHLIERGGGDQRPKHQHFALIVDDFETVWNRAEDRGAIDEDTGYVRALPNGVVQCYIRDPSGNRVEFMWPDVETLPDTIATHVDHVEAEAPTEEPAGATIAPNVTVYED